MTQFSPQSLDWVNRIIIEGVPMGDDLKPMICGRDGMVGKIHLEYSASAHHGL
jgi:hypothetical protein